MARRGITPEAQARADRIAAALCGLLDEDSVEPVRSPDGEGDPYRPVPQRATTKAKAEFACPRCGDELRLHYTKGAEIHRCGGCLGFWLGPRRLESIIDEPVESAPVNVSALQQRMRAMAPGDTIVRYRACPRCRNMMNRRNYGDVSGVVVDECPTHGVFLDRGEFEAIEVFIKQGGLQAQRRRRAERQGVAQQERARAAARAGPASLLMSREPDSFWNRIFGRALGWD